MKNFLSVGEDPIVFHLNKSPTTIITGSNGVGKTSIVDGITLEDISDWKDSDYIVGCITVYCGEVRLIDNITYRK